MTISELSRRAFLVVAAGALLLSPASGVAQGFQIVVNSSNPAQTVTKDQIARTFMKKIKKWDGTNVTPVDQRAGAAVRESFTKAIHGKGVNAVISFWQQEIFAGRDVPPAEKAGDAAVIEFVKANPGAVGYVSASAATDGVRVIEVR